MSDNGYRPAPPPEEGRPQGRASGQARGYGAAPGGGSREPDYGWGGGRQQGGPQGQGQPPRRPQQGYGTPPGGQAPVGRGSASVGGARPSGSASVGSARPTGSASVGGAGRASVGSASVGGAGRASVGSASVGSASVGSASVGAARVNLDDADARTGRAGNGGRRRAGNGPLNKDDLEGTKKKRKRLGRKMLAALIAMGILFVASVTVIATYFFQNTPPLEGVFREGESSAFYSADGTQVGAFGDTLRLQADPEEMPDTVKDALVSLEDRKFWDHNGINVGRTLAALVNNVTGGETQGASTITQQYAGMVLDARDEISYDRKAREAALAIKMESEYDKDEIIGAYLNMAYFGRGAYGIEAAAKNYFNVALKDLTYDQAAFIVMQVKSPNGYYDPYYEDAYDEAASADRWNFAMDAMVETGVMPQSERDTYTYETVIEALATEFNASGSWGGNTDLGFIINERDGYVFDELLTRYGITKDMLKGADGTGGGYTVKLTIDSDIQNALRTTGSRGLLAVEKDDDGNMLDADGAIVTDRDKAALAKNDEGYVYFENTNEEAALESYEDYMTTAMVAIDPDTGAVLGYYGGDNGFGVDKAGEESPHPPSSTFKMITAATAIENGDSIESWFNASSPREFDTLKNDDTETCIGGGDYPNCTLRNGSQSSKLELTLTDAIRDSKNTPMYAISQKYGSNAILDYATDMGLDMMTQTRQAYDDTGQVWDVNVGYEFDAENNTYTQYGQAKDSTGNWVLDEFGNIALDTPIQLDNCNPVVNTEGIFLADEDGEADACDIGGRGDTDPFYHHLAFGQYPTSVADMAAMYATIANDGEHWPTHFIESVTDSAGNPVEPESAKLEPTQAIEVEVARDLQWVGSEIGGESATDKLDRDYFGKTGTWQATCDDCESSWNAHAWYVGAIPQMSIAAWVGNATSESDPIADPDNNKSNVFGSNTAYPVWFQAMTSALANKEGDEHWDEKMEWGGKANYGSMSTWDIEDAGGPIDGGAFCAAEPEDPLCAGQVDEQAQEDCEADGGTWDGEACQPADDDDTGTDDPTTDPTGEESTDEECPIWEPNCNETDPTDEPTTEGATTEEPGDNGRG
ncbi:transglycosylase domain-containing protein [Glycomyces sp. NPDC047369]